MSTAVSMSEEYTKRLIPGLPGLMEKFFDRYDLPSSSFDSAALKILSKRYLIKNDEGEVIESPDVFLARVAVAVALRGMEVRANEGEDIPRVQLESRLPHNVLDDAFEYYRMMAGLEFLPNSPTLMNAGTSIGNLAACFVVPVEDSMGSIMESVKNVALIHQSGGGTGMDFSDLRPEGSQVKSTQGVASGPISFMKVFDATTEQIKQGGKRRGANMGILRIDHPDIESFISAKDEEGVLTNFNLSVAVTDEFMHALSGLPIIYSEESPTTFYGGKAAENSHYYPIRNPKDGSTIRMQDARDIWKLLVEHAHKTGDPGVVFIDTINETNPFDLEAYPAHRISATNPCGEQPLEAYEACNLGSINLANFITLHPGGERTFDHERLRITVQKAVRFLDDVIDAATYPLPFIEEKVKENRKIGLGVMGLADVLIDLRLPYNSKPGRDFAHSLMYFIYDESRKASTSLARARGVFPSWDESIYAKDGLPMRNATVTTIAPTGTIGMLANASSGIEPLFAMKYKKTVMDGTEFDYINEAILLLEDSELPTWIDWLDTYGSLPQEAVERYPYLVTAHEVSPEDHVLMQSVIQSAVDNAVSKTINMPAEATVDDVDKVYRLAFENNCKGVTIYRDGSKEGQVLTKKSVAKLEEVVPDVQEVPEVYVTPAPQLTPQEEEDLAPKPRPEAVWGPTVRVDTPCGGLYVTITEDENGQPLEIFARLGKGGGCASAVMESTGRLASHMLRSGHSAETVIKQLKDVSCGQKTGFGENSVRSCQDAIALVLRRYIDGNYHQLLQDELSGKAPGGSPTHNPAPPSGERKYMNGACPECGGPIEHEGGCAACRSCGYSKCA